MEGSKIHVDASNFIRRCWQTNISDRPSIEEIIKFRSNFFLSSVKSTPEGIPYFTYDDFNGLKRVGHGGYGIVKMGYYKEGDRSRPVAVKEFVGCWDKYSDREIQLLKGSSHLNIITIFGVIRDGEDSTIHTGYVMEYMEFGSLHNRIHDFSTNYNNRLISKWIQQIGAGLQYLHERSIIHRDIKPKNILLASLDHLKLADFGLARSVSGRDTNTAAHWIGTDSYRAPEVLVSGNYGYAADVFSFGITIWEIIHRKYPYEHVTTSKDSFGNICVDLPMEENKIHVDASIFIRRCWQTNISDRPSIAEIIQFGSTFEQTNPPGAIIPVGHQRKRATIISSSVDQTQERPIKRKRRGSITRTMDSISQNIVKKTILVMGGIDENNCTSRTMTVLNADRSHWIELQLKLPYDVFNSGAVFLHNELYVVGGQFNPKALYKLDKNLKWKRLADMNIGRTFITNSCLEANGYIWVFGGEDGDLNSLKSVERYDPKEDKWTLMPEMSTARSSAAAVFWKDRIIVCGGGIGKGTTISAECFLLETGEWTRFPPLPGRLDGHSLVSFENKLILMGGQNNELPFARVKKNVWEMDPLQPKDGWKSLPSMEYSRASFRGLVLDQEIYALGGYDNNAVLDRVEIFDGKSWRDGPSFPYGRYHHSAVVIPPSLADRLCQYKP